MLKLIRFCVLVTLIISVVACKNKTTIDTPIVANNFHDLLVKIENSCKNINKNDCEHIWALIQLTTPSIKNSNSLINQEEKMLAEELFVKLNGKTPRELLQIYKSNMLNIVQRDIEKDKEMMNELENIMDTYNSTSKYLRQFTVNGVKNSFLNNSANVMWNIYNNSEFNIKKIVGYVDYYDGDNLTFKSEDFIYNFNMPLLSRERLTILVNVDVDPEKIKELKKNKDMKVDVKFKSMEVSSSAQKLLIFQLSESYYKMKEMLRISEELYKKRIDLINSIHAE